MASAAIGRGALVVMATDTVYGLAADAFSADAVAKLLAAKGRGRSMPPPVLIAGTEVLAALTVDTPPEVNALAEAFWPGGLTLICWAQPSLAWDLGETGGTVAVRVPDHGIALSLLRSTGPLAVSSANLTGRPVGESAAQAAEQLGEAVEVYLESGTLASGTSSTIVDATGDRLVVVRPGAISLARLREVVPGIVGADDPEPQEQSSGTAAQVAAAPGAADDQEGGRTVGRYNARAAFAQSRSGGFVDSGGRTGTYDARSEFAERGRAAERAPDDR